MLSICTPIQLCIQKGAHLICAERRSLERLFGARGFLNWAQLVVALIYHKSQLELYEVIKLYNPATSRQI
jgi:hypothetical protein